MNTHQSENKKMFIRLTEEVVALRKEVHSTSKKFKESEKQKMAQPFENMNEFLLFESSISNNEDKFTGLVSYFFYHLIKID